MNEKTIVDIMLQDFADSPGEMPSTASEVVFTEQAGDYHLAVARVQWSQNATSYNGYVGIPERHKGYGRHYCARLFDGIHVHGGLTFSGAGKEGYPLPVEHVWWLGFDGMHAWDTHQNTDQAYILAEARRLLEQLKEIEA